MVYWIEKESTSDIYFWITGLCKLFCYLSVNVGLKMKSLRITVFAKDNDQLWGFALKTLRSRSFQVWKQCPFFLISFKVPLSLFWLTCNFPRIILLILCFSCLSLGLYKNMCGNVHCLEVKDAAHTQNLSFHGQIVVL